MISPTHWGKLTSLHPNFNNISLSENPSNLIFTPSLQQSSDNQCKCLIYQAQQECSISYTGGNLAIQINGQTMNEGEASRIHSGYQIKVIMKVRESEIPVEYIFSSELMQSQKETLKREGKENEEIVIHEKKAKFHKDFEDESKCGICEKMIYECVSVVPCLHSFCMDCFMRCLRSSQACSECGERLVEFRKNVFLNNLIEGYQESGCQRDRPPEEYKKINERLNTRRVSARFEYANGDVYGGKWKKGRKDGKGKMVFRNGDVYNGDWKNGKMEGKGKGVFVNGNVYQGEFKHGSIEGKGKMIYRDGALYEGEWKNTKKEGKGKYIWKNGNVYEGDFGSDKIEGEGKLTYADRNVYEGSWKNEKKEGKGKMTFVDRSVYEGDWRNNKRQGKGKMMYADGKIYEGRWKYNKREGKGEMTYPNGDVYEMTCRNDKVQSRRKIRDQEGSSKKKRR